MIYSTGPLRPVSERVGQLWNDRHGEGFRMPVISGRGSWHGPAYGNRPGTWVGTGLVMPGTKRQISSTRESSSALELSHHYSPFASLTVFIRCAFVAFTLVLNECAFSRKALSTAANLYISRAGVQRAGPKANTVIFVLFIKCLFA